MKRTVSIDDRDGRSLAETTVYLGLNGEWRELDLTIDHWTQLGGLLKEWFDAGRPVKSAPRKREYRPQEEHGMTSRDYWRQFRQWATEGGRNFTTDSGKFYPKRDDVTDFEKWLTEQDRQALS